MWELVWALYQGRGGVITGTEPSGEGAVERQVIPHWLCTGCPWPSQCYDTRMTPSHSTLSTRGCDS